MRDEERFKLLFGPYQSPRVRLHDELFCRVRNGPMVVYGWSDAPIPWPMTRTLGRRGGAPTIIVCDDLVRALEQESNIAVQHWWGVGVGTVCKWRRALGVGHITPGTMRLIKEWMPHNLPEEKRVQARMQGNNLELRVKAVEARRHNGKLVRRPWTIEEDALLGTSSDHKVALQLERATVEVSIRRRQLGLPAYMPQNSPDRWHTFAPVQTDQLKQRRLALGLTQREIAQRAQISYARYRQLEVGKGWRVKPKTMLHLAAALQCTVEDLSPEGISPEGISLPSNEATSAANSIED